MNSIIRHLFTFLILASFLQAAQLHAMNSNQGVPDSFSSSSSSYNASYNEMKDMKVALNTDVKESATKMMQQNQAAAYNFVLNQMIRTMELTPQIVALKSNLEELRQQGIQENDARVEQVKKELEDLEKRLKHDMAFTANICEASEILNKLIELAAKQEPKLTIT